MVNFVLVSDMISSHNGLQICISDSRPVQVLQWQCQGEPTADLVRGVYTTTQLHIEKAINFVRLAKETCAELVLTPEYSFPCEVLNTIVNDGQLWPERGSLWCLGMQGYSRQDFAKKLEEWKSTGKTLVIGTAFDQILIRNFVDTLIYLFLLDDGRLCILPQFKTTPMSDKWNEYEVRGLCTSDLIYVFDLKGKSDDQNRFLSILCSDVLGIKAEEILDNTKGMSLTIFHAQLNQEPRHPDFRSFRSAFFDRNAGRDIRFITLNWAEGTVIDGLQFSKPWSAFYKRSIRGRGEVAEQPLRACNHEKGTYYTLHNFTEVWYSHREEHCKRFDINKAYQLGASYPSIAHKEPITQDYFIYNAVEKFWRPVTERHYTLEELIGSHGQEYDFPLKATPHDNDAFFGLCFGHFLEGELMADENELVTRLFSGSDQESDLKRHAKAIQYKKLIQLIKKQEFPPEFEYLNNNHVFYLDSATAEDKLKYGNVYQKDVEPDHRNPSLSALFIISECISKDEVEKQVDMLSKRLHPNLHNRMVVYYFSPETDRYECFYDHLMQTRIDKATYSKSLSSIKG